MFSIPGGFELCAINLLYFVAAQAEQSTTLSSPCWHVQVAVTFPSERVAGRAAID